MTCDADSILRAVRESMARLIDAAEPHHGLIPSILDRETGAMLTQLPPAIQGQRDSDRALLGSNLMHDQVLLRTMDAMSKWSGDPTFAQAVDRYLTRFASHCTDTPSGLFPWGEHSYWHLTEDRVANSYVDAASRGPAPVTHDHLRQAPLWLWERLHALNPACVQRFAHGLDFHWSNPERTEYIRHAKIMLREFHGMGKRSCDFPRHGGFYIFDLAYAWTKSRDAVLMEQIHRYADYWWAKKQANNLALIESRSPESDARFNKVTAPGQTLSLASSLLESALLLDEGAPELAKVFRDRARAYTDGFFAAPHDLDRGIYLMLWKEGEPDGERMPIWGSVYGLWPASYVAVNALCHHRLSGDDRLLTWASAVGRSYANEPFPDNVAVPAMDAGLALGLHADLYDITRDRAWLDRGLTLAATLMSRYLDRPTPGIPRGAAGINCYDSQMGPGFVIHGLTRIAMLSQAPDTCPLPADYTAR